MDTFSQRPEGDQPSHSIRAAGVLRYSQESDRHSLNINAPPETPPVTVYSGKCEYCGEKARPSLNLTWLQDPGTLIFCCAQRQQLSEMLIEQRCVFEGRRAVKSGVTTTRENKPATELDNLLIRDKGMKDYNKFLLELPNEYGTQLPVAETSAPQSKVIRFRLSCAPQPGCWLVCPSNPTEKCVQNEPEQTQESITPFCDPTTLRRFGLCHHQDVAGVLQKNYSSGVTFLTMFPDGCAQVLYPLRLNVYAVRFPARDNTNFSQSLLAVIVVAEENGRVCIVYDDSKVTNQPIRAVFQSDGRATCYHSNGNIWLSLNRSGGQCLDEIGAKVRRWSWSPLSLPPTPLQPIFFSLNKTIGIRVLGKQQVFVSFMATGQQAKFSVGTSNIQGKSKLDEPASVLEEEQFLLAARRRIKRTIQHLHSYIKTKSP